MAESIQCWQCGTRMTLDELSSNDGDCPECEVEVHLADYLSEALEANQRLAAELAELKAKMEGMVLVPVEPTAEMVAAAFVGKVEAQCVQHQERSRVAMAANYKAMLAAAPSKEGEA